MICGPPPPDLGPDRIFITRRAFGYSVDVRNDLTALNRPYFRWTRAGAERKGRKLLAPKRARETWELW